MEKMLNKETIEWKENMFKILKGSLLAMVITIVSLFIYALLLTYTNIGEESITIVVIAITGVSIMIGSLISSWKIKKNGLINGGIVGLIYIISIYILSSISLVGFNFNMASIIMIIVSVLTGMAGGAIGVNIK